MQRGEIYWVDFEPKKGREQGGIRPALVIQNDIGNRYSSTTIVAVMTRTVPEPLYPFMVVVEPHESGLSERSIVNCAQLRTVSSDPSTTRILPPRGTSLVRPIGRLSVDKMTAVDIALHRSLGLRCPRPL